MSFTPSGNPREDFEIELAADGQLTPGVLFGRLLYVAAVFVRINEQQQGDHRHHDQRDERSHDDGDYPDDAHASASPLQLDLTTGSPDSVQFARTAPILAITRRSAQNRAWRQTQTWVTESVCCDAEGRGDVGPRVCSHRRPTLIIVNCGIAVLQQQTMLCWQFRTALIPCVNAHALSVRMSRPS